MAKPNIQAGDETNISEITISPDGRVFLFGASEPLLDMFVELGWRDSMPEFHCDSSTLASKREPMAQFGECEARSSVSCE